MTEFVELGDIAEINPRLPRGIDESQTVSFLPMAAVSEDGYVAYEGKRTLIETKKGFTYFNRGDFLIAKITPCFENGKAALTHEINYPVGYGSTEFHVVRPNKSKLNERYMYHLLWSDRFRFAGKNQMRGAAGQKRISADFLKSYKIPLPPLPEQKRIAAILDKADAIRRKRQQSIELADQFLRSVFLDMFGDPIIAISKFGSTTLGQVVLDFQNGTGKGKQFYGSGTKVANIGDLYEGHVFVPKKYSLLEVSQNEIERYRLNKGDLLFVRSSVKRSGVAYCAAYNSDEVCLFSSFMIRAMVDQHLFLPEFLAYMLRLPTMRTQLINASNTATITNISQAGLSAIVLPCVPMSAQIVFVNWCHRSTDLQSKTTDFMLRSKNLFNSLGKKVFDQSLSSPVIM